MSTFSDNFNRADGSIGGDYDAMAGHNGLEVSSNAMRAAGSDYCGALVKTSVAAFNPNQSARFTLSAIGMFDVAGVIVRGDTAGNGYLLAQDGARVMGLGKLVEGEVEELSGFDDRFVVEVGQELTLVASGDVLSVFLDDVLLFTVEDTSFPNGQPGLWYNWGNSRATRLDNFSASDVDAGSVPSGTLIFFQGN